jgi:hypothetical protein
MLPVALAIAAEYELHINNRSDLPVEDKSKVSSNDAIKIRKGFFRNNIFKMKNVK